MRNLFITLLLVLLSSPALAEPLETSAKQAIVVDYDTGAILLAKNAEEQMPTSSMSKVMSMVSIFDALKNGEIKLDETFRVSEKAWRKGGSKMFVEVNKDVKIEDLIRGVIVQSGNDATIVLAEGLSGSEDAFADTLNEKAAEIGMTNSQFKNASGWPDPDHYSTAKDLALLAAYLIKTYPDYYKYYSEKEFEYNEIKQPNRNPLLYRDLGADGVKTGHTEAGGYGLIGSGTRNGRRVILVVNGLESEKARADESSRLLDWGLGRFENKTIIKAGDVLETAEVSMGKTTSVPLVTQEDILATIPRGNKKDIKVEIKYAGPVTAPIKQGQEIGTVNISIPDQDAIITPVFAAESVAQKGFFAKALENAKNLIKGL